MMFINNPLGRAACQIVNFVAAFSLVYTLVWHTGFTDRNKVKYGYSKEDKLKGAKAGFWAVIPFTIPSIVLFLSKIGVFGDGFLYFFRLLTPIFFPINYSLFPATFLLSEIGYSSIIVSFLLTFSFAVISFFGYYLGYSDKTLLSSLKRKKTES